MEDLKAWVDELSKQAEAFGYRFLWNPRDRYCYLVSKWPTDWEQGKRLQSSFSDLDEAGKFLASLQATPPDQACWSVDISANIAYESTDYVVVVELPTKSEAQAQELAYEQAAGFVNNRFGKPNLGLMKELPFKVPRPNRKHDGETALSFPAWIMSEG